MDLRSRQLARRLSRHLATSPATPRGEEYRRECERLPWRIRECGLAVSLGALQANADGDPRCAEMAVLEDLATVLEFERVAALIEGAMRSDLVGYMHLTRRTLEACEWLRWFAKTDAMTNVSRHGGPE